MPRRSFMYRHVRDQRFLVPDPVEARHAILPAARHVDRAVHVSRLGFDQFDLATEPPDSALRIGACGLSSVSQLLPDPIDASSLSISRSGTFLHG